MANARLYGGIEAGGSKFLSAIGTGPDDLRAETRFATTAPGETIDRAIAFFRGSSQATPIAAVGIGSFGPADVDPASATWGHITTTPKPGWQDIDLAGAVGEALGVPVRFDTDVNAAALGEHRWGAARGLDSFIYVTVGTGIGGGGMMNGRLMHGLMHPEMGHIRVPHDHEADPFPGACPFHGDCLEGLAAAPAIQARWGRSPDALPDDHPAWSLEARYLALGLANLIHALSPQRIIIGGGIMRRRGLIEAVRGAVHELVGGYLPSPAIRDNIDGYIRRPALRERAGVLGAIALAQPED